MSLFEDVKAAGLPFDSHESDLYVRDSAEFRAILERYPLKKANARRFKNQAPSGVGEIWVDIPFAYEPFWEKSSRRP